MRKLMHIFHLLPALPLGIIITIICLSGSLMVFEKEITVAVHPERYFVEDTLKQRMTLEQLLKEVRKEIPNDVKITGVRIPTEKNRTYEVFLNKPRKASIFVNPYTGTVVGKNDKLPVFWFLFKLHRWLLDVPSAAKANIGKNITGITTIFFVIILLSGLYLWFPRNRKSFKNKFSIEIKKGKFRFWHDLHVTGGFYALLFLLLLSLTGLTWSYVGYQKTVYGLLGVKQEKKLENKMSKNSEPEKKGKNQMVPNAETTSSEFHVWENALKNIRNEKTASSNYLISDKTISVSLGGWGNQRASDRYAFNNKGDIISFTPYKEQDRKEKIRGWIYSLHVGEWGGLFSKILTFLISLLGASFPITGYYLFIKKKMKKRKKKNQ